MADGLGTPGGVVSDEDHRLALAGLVSPQTSSLAVRTGVLVAPGSTALVTGTSATGTMTVSIAAHHWVTTRGTGDGIYLGTKEAAGTVNIAAAPGANSRIDVVYVKQNDSSSTISPDGSTGELYGVVTGTAAASPTKPALPVGATELATVQVAVGATATNGAGVTITNTALQVSARGATIWVRSQAERDALTKFPGLTVYRIDTGDIEMVNLANSGWVIVYDQAPAATPYLFTVLVGAGSSLNNSAWEDVPFDQDDTDTNSWHPIATYPANALCTVNLTGWYFVQAGIAWGASATGIRGVRMIKNGTAGTAGLTGTLVRGSGIVLPSAGAGVITSTVTPERRIFLNAGDTLKVQGFQSSGASLALRNVIAGSDDQVCFLEVRYDRA